MLALWMGYGLINLVSLDGKTRKSSRSISLPHLTRVTPKLVTSVSFAPELAGPVISPRKTGNIFEMVSVTWSGVSLRNSTRKIAARRVPSSARHIPAPVCARRVEHGVAAADVGLERVLRAHAVAPAARHARRTGGRSSGNPCRWKETRRRRNVPCETSALCWYGHLEPFRRRGLPATLRGC